MKEKNLQQSALYPARVSFRFDGEIKSFTDKQKLKEFSTTRPNLQKMLKELLYVEKKDRNWKQENYEWKAHQKVKHTVKVGSHLHTNMISNPATVRRKEHKCSILKMHLKEKDQQRKTILFIYGLLYQILMVIANWKSTIDMHTKKKQQPKRNIKLVIKWQEKRTKEEGKKKDFQKQI